MRIQKSLFLVFVLSLSLAVGFGMFVGTDSVVAKNSYLNSVNSTCGTSYGCGICHIDPKGGGPLTTDGQAYVASGYDSCYFCPTVCGGTTCTDADADGYAVEGGNCGAIDCNDNNAAVNPGAVEICNNNIDDNCNGKVDCADAACANDAACAGICVPTAANERKGCTDGIDNDCDGAIDCADSDCRKNRACR